MKNTPSASTTPGRLRRRVTSALLVLGLSVGTMAATATRVEAATIVLACFTPEVSNFLARTIPIQLQALTTAGYVTVEAATLNDGGCATLIVPAAYRAYYVRVFIESNQNYFRYNGVSTQTFIFQGGQVWQDPSLWGHAGPGNDSRLWYLYGTVACTGCNLRFSVDVTGAQTPLDPQWSAPTAADINKP